MEDNCINFYTELNNGIKMPRLGLGTFGIQNVSEIVYQSIKSGARLIDTATRYENEKAVGEGIKRAIDEGIVSREDLFIVTKLYCLSRHKVEEAIKNSLNELGLDFVDLYLDHWPHSTYETNSGDLVNMPLHIFWPKMEELVEKGYTKTIGCSNYHIQLLLNLLSFAKIKPAVNQFELHPLLPEKELVKFCKSNGIAVMAYNSLGRGPYSMKQMTEEVNLLENQFVKTLAERYNTTAGCIALNWALTNGYIVIPATSNPERMGENLKALSFKLSAEDMTEMDKLDIGKRFNWSSKLDWSKGVEYFA
jgi:D-xylose reductase